MRQQKELETYIDISPKMGRLHSLYYELQYHLFSESNRNKFSDVMFVDLMPIGAYGYTVPWDKKFITLTNKKEGNLCTKVTKVSQYLIKVEHDYTALYWTYSKSECEVCRDSKDQTVTKLELEVLEHKLMKYINELLGK